MRPLGSVDIILLFKILRMFKSRRIRWVSHVARMGDRRSAYRVVGGPEGKKHLEDIGVDGIIILTLILRKWDREARTRLLWLRIGDRWPALVNAVMNLRVP